MHTHHITYAHLANAYIQDVDISCVEWVARRPDLNPLHAWDELERRVRQRNPAPACLHGLRNALMEEWPNIDQNRFRNLVYSMPHRLTEVIRTRGGNIKY